MRYNPRITGDDERRSGLHGRANSGRTEVVSIPQSVGNERHRPAPETPDPKSQERRRAHAVHVVVSVDQDGLAVIDRAQDPGDGSIEIPQLARWVEVGQAWAKKPLGELGIGNPTDGENATDGGG